ncbi:hypothetical protein AUC69_15520 [Methyloceanibacter superfactus]|uniref:CheR-type methyltransferase domain-containing protein n=1 Tax=Methyloceanibacter superfactus TaxID=1774969 RepID=A0A1E3VRL7_9HYPH|nr:hypothetical protein AUC69_15520 [Methyloceanibacter superfactus]
MQRGLPVSMLIKYFRKAGKGWQIKPEIRAMVTFHEHNLLDDCQELGTFDIIFCRNVLIYFDERLRKAVLGRVSGQLAGDGYLVLGSAETTTRVSADFMPVPEPHHGIFCFTPEARRGRRRGPGSAAGQSRWTGLLPVPIRLHGGPRKTGRWRSQECPGCG